MIQTKNGSILVGKWYIQILGKLNGKYGVWRIPRKKRVRHLEPIHINVNKTLKELKHEIGNL